MHGVLLLDTQGNPASPLVTWQDARCSMEFLADLRARTGFQLRTGFGCATLAWYAAAAKLPPAASYAATIHDWVAARLCGLARPVTDPTDAASWGLFELTFLGWDLEAARKAGIPVGLLPGVVTCGEVVGRVSAETSARFGIPQGIPVTAAMGDNQASLIATLGDPEKELALTLGTGGQLSAVLPASDTGQLLAAAPREADSSWEFRPFPGGRLLAAGASLCGGSAWQWLAVTVEKLQDELGMPRLPRDNLYARLNELAAAAPRADASGVAVHPHFLGERHAPTLRGSIEGITLDNLSLGTLARSLAESIAANLRDLLPARFREGRTRVVASGNALERNPILRQAASEALGLAVVMSAPPEAAAVGAALTARAAAQGGARA
jgi:sedoheptulokinase